jgi:hypothetical protein
MESEKVVMDSTGFASTNLNFKKNIDRNRVYWVFKKIAYLTTLSTHNICDNDKIK